jgi:glycerol-3-phosphate dehydrogenase
MNRREVLDTLREKPEIDVLVIGGGINGVGTFRDLALQGVDVLLVDRGDLCSGASAASSHMAHGGIRYLENGEFRLVKEALRERNRMLRNAPHYVKPLPTTIPIFKRFSGFLNAPLKFLRLLNRPSERGSLVIKFGLFLYDWYVRDFRVMPTHQFMNRDESLNRWPKLNPDILNTATYYDGEILAPERLCLELALDGEADHSGAHALNYVSAAGGDGKRITLRDELTGQTLDVQPKVVINAAGPWIDFVNTAIDGSTRFIGGTKGSHLVLDHLELREHIGDHEFFFENKDGRIVLILPYFNRVIVGTSDIPIENPDEARITAEEIDYFIGMVARVFPAIQIDRSHIVFGFTGVRPLPASDAKSAGQISRDHSIRVIEGVVPVLNLVGGKWTTYRAFSEEAADEALKHLGIARKRSTSDLSVGGGKGYPEDDAARQRWLADINASTGIARDRLKILLDRYGTRAAEMAKYIALRDDASLALIQDYSRREIEYLALYEKVEHLADIVLRRTVLGILGCVSPILLRELATIAGEALGWSAEQQQLEIEHTINILKQHYLAPTII